MNKVLIDGKEIRRDTTADLFKNALNLARESGHFQEIDAILDYAITDRQEIELSNYRFDAVFSVNIGAGEGVYIDAYIQGQFSESSEVDTQRIGTLKTLQEGLPALELMGKACGILTHFAHLYVNREIDRYTPEQELLAEAERKSRMPGRSARLMSKEKKNESLL